MRTSIFILIVIALVLCVIPPMKHLGREQREWVEKKEIVIDNPADHTVIVIDTTKPMSIDEIRALLCKAKSNLIIVRYEIENYNQQTISNHE